MVAALVRRSLAAQFAAAGPSWASSSRAFASSVRSSDNRETPARAHRPNSMTGPDAPGQRPSQHFSKEESLGTGPTPEQDDISNKVAANLSASKHPAAGLGVTRERVGNSAMNILETMTASTGSADGSTTPFGAENSAPHRGPEDVSPPITTPSAPGLDPVYQTPSGPIYTTATLPFKTDPTLEFLVNLLMKDGKKAQAERMIRKSLEYVSQLTHANPLPLVQHAIERCSPLVRMTSRKQGAKRIQIPLALTNRQSKRKGIVWIIEAANKRYDRELPRRLAAEFIAVTEGSSPALQRKEEQHKLAMANRANASIRV